MAERTLSVSGLRASFASSRHEPSLWTLEVDGTPQSQVDAHDPRTLHFEYVRRIGFALDTIGTPGAPITAVHLGAGALTLPRYVEATRPGSRQQVVEIEPELIELVRSELPLPARANIRVRMGDARSVLGKLPSGLTGAVDAIVIDIFAGAQTPAHVTSREFYAETVRLLAPGGLVLVNVADGDRLAFARNQVATVRDLFPEVAAIANTTLLKGRRFGNVVIIAGRQPLPNAQLQRAIAGDMFPAKLVHGGELDTFVSGARIVRDTDAVDSPLPGRSIFIAR
ncbi:MAG TPA: fused MFS/spermidine synthase [Microbacteriaceae bacterium]|nr:fused MFS/spermidine synthase [Microbacteriaceae bacterium]